MPHFPSDVDIPQERVLGRPLSSLLDAGQRFVQPLTPYAGGGAVGSGTGISLADLIPTSKTDAALMLASMLPMGKAAKGAKAAAKAALAAEYDAKFTEMVNAIRKGTRVVDDAEIKAFTKPGQDREYMTKLKRQHTPLAPVESNGFIERVDGNINPFDDADEFLYHVTTPAAAKAIMKKGFLPGGQSAQTMGEGAYRDYSRGKVFLTEKAGVPFWQERIGAHLEHQGKKGNTVVLRIPAKHVQALEDAAGTRDARAKAFYTESPIPPKL